MLKNGLPHRARIHLRRDFERIIQGSNKYKNSGLALWASRREKGLVRFAVVVSKKLGPAVVRNRTKRLLREAFRAERARLIPGADIIVKPLDSEKLNTVQAAQQSLTSLCTKAGLVK